MLSIEDYIIYSKCIILLKNFINIFLLTEYKMLTYSKNGTQLYEKSSTTIKDKHAPYVEMELVKPCICHNLDASIHLHHQKCVGQDIFR